jgi:hypothetical protein
MISDEALSTLRALNLWRRGESETCPDLQQVGLAIDAACVFIERIRDIHAQRWDASDQMDAIDEVMRGQNETGNKN